MSSLRARQRVIQRPSGPPRLNRDSPQAQGLVGWWPANEGAGTTLRDFARQAADAPFGANQPAWVITNDGPALDFESASLNPHAETADTAWYTDGTPWSITAWAQTTDQSTQVLWSFRSGTDTGNSALLYPCESTNSRTRLLMEINHIVDDTALADGDPHLIVVTTNGVNDTRIYIDGILRYTDTSAREVASTTNLTFGAWRPGQQNFDGRGWDFRFYNKQLSVAENWRLYDPATRWDLYWRPRVIVPGFVAAPAVAGSKPPSGLALLGSGS